jgi:hypothetical protein
MLQPNELSAGLVARFAARGPLTGMRASLLLRSRAALRSRGLLAALDAAMPAAARRVLEGSSGSEMLDLDVAHDHYQASDGILSSDAEIVEIGREVGAEHWNGAMRVVAKLIGGLGATPWVAFERSPRLYEQTMRGGGLEVRRLAERRALVELHRNSLCRYRSFAFGLVGSWIGAAEPFAPIRGGIVTRDDDRVSFSLTWDVPAASRGR